MDLNELRNLAKHRYPAEAEALATVNQSGYAIKYVNPDCLI